MSRLSSEPKSPQCPSQCPPGDTGSRRASIGTGAGQQQADRPCRYGINRWYCHQIGSWDNAFPYVGDFPSWGHRVGGDGHRVVTVGKLHYRQPGDDAGFPEQRLPMHVRDGVGDIYSLIRRDMEARSAKRKEIPEAHAGESDYTRYDRAIAAEACSWLREEAVGENRRWVLFVSFVTPHHPLIAPEEFAALYPPEQVVFPHQYPLTERPSHPVLDETGLTGSTRVLYCSDHGAKTGDFGFWLQ